MRLVALLSIVALLVLAGCIGESTPPLVQPSPTPPPEVLPLIDNSTAEITQEYGDERYPPAMTWEQFLADVGVDNYEQLTFEQKKNLIEMYNNYSQGYLEALREVGS